MATVIRGGKRKRKGKRQKSFDEIWASKYGKGTDSHADLRTAKLYRIQEESAAHQENFPAMSRDDRR